MTREEELKPIIDHLKWELHEKTHTIKSNFDDKWILKKLDDIILLATDLKHYYDELENLRRKP